MLWIKKDLNKKGLALPMVFLIAVVFIPVAVGLVFLLRQETKVVRKSKVSAQAEQLAEGAANRGLIELKKRINEDLKENLDTNDYAPNVIRNTYVANPMNFIHDCLILSASTDFFDIWATSATLTFSENLETGSYSTTVAISTTQAPVWEPHGGGPGNPIARFYFKYKITTESTVKYEAKSDKIFGLVIDSLSPNAVRPDGEFEIKIAKRNFCEYNLFCESLQDNNWFTERYDFSGPVHFNDEINFFGDPGNNGLSGTFHDEVTCTAATANFFHGGQLDADFYDNGDGVASSGDDRPVFNAGFQRGVDTIDMPDFVQMQLQQTTALGLPDGAAIPACANGVYVPNDGANNVTGGIYIQGDVNNMTMSTAGGGNRAVYTIDHDNGTTYTVSVNMNTGNTRFNDGSDHNYTGTTNGVIFTNGGDINAFSGTVQEDSQVTVAATGGITITDHVQYADDPLVNPTATNVLGLLSWNDDIMIGTSAPDDLTVQASVMTPSGEFEVENYNSCGLRGDLNLLGGVIGDEMGYHGVFDGVTGAFVHGYADQYVYDVRFKEGIAPPKFPTIGTFRSDVLDFNTAPSWRRLKEKI
jgi:hypothetical protein